MQDRENKMREIFDTAQKMKRGEITPARSFESIEAFIETIKENHS